MSLTITRAVTGWILTDSEEPEAPWAFGGYESSEVDDFADALRTISDLIGPTTSRYDEKRVYVRVEPGDKYDGGKK